MSKITNIIFNGENHYITSPFGSRDPIETKAGASSNVHNGVDYGTNGKKIPQYAIEDGEVSAVGTDQFGAKFVKIKYPRINKEFWHWHLDSVSVVKNQAVKKYTKIGTTGMTGKATGVHLHLSIIDLKSKCYIDPEKYAQEYSDTNAFLSVKGYFGPGDKHDNIDKISRYMYYAHPNYTDKNALGGTLGPYLLASIKEFQKEKKIEVDGCVGPITLSKLREEGFKY